MVGRVDDSCTEEPEKRDEMLLPDIQQPLDIALKEWIGWKFCPHQVKHVGRHRPKDIRFFNGYDAQSPAPWCQRRTAKVSHAIVDSISKIPEESGGRCVVNRLARKPATQGVSYQGVDFHFFGRTAPGLATPPRSVWPAISRRPEVALRFLEKPGGRPLLLVSARRPLHQPMIYL